MSREQNIRSKVTRQPAIEPVTLAELRLQLAVNDSSFDAFMESKISASRDFIERYLGRKLIKQEITMYADNFGRSGSMPYWEGSIVAPVSAVQGNSSIELDFFPVISVTSFSYFQEDDVEQDFSSDNRRLDNYDEDINARISLKRGAVWPTNLRDTSGIKIVYEAGYGELAADVPANIRDAILMMAAFLFSNRGDCTIESALTDSGAKDTLDTYKSWRV